MCGDEWNSAAGDGKEVIVKLPPVITSEKGRGETTGHVQRRLSLDSE